MLLGTFKMCDTLQIAEPVVSPCVYGSDFRANHTSKGTTKGYVTVLLVYYPRIQRARAKHRNRSKNNRTKQAYYYADTLVRDRGWGRCIYYSPRQRMITSRVRLCTHL